MLMQCSRANPNFGFALTPGAEMRSASVPYTYSLQVAGCKQNVNLLIKLYKVHKSFFCLFRKRHNILTSIFINLTCHIVQCVSIFKRYLNRKSNIGHPKKIKK